MPNKKIIVWLMLLLTGWLPVHAQRGYKNYISNQNVSSMVQDPNGFLWLATNHGLNRFDGNNYVHFFSSDGRFKLPNDDILSIDCDEQGLLWMSTECGICAYNPKDGTFLHPEFTNFIYCPLLRNLNPTHVVAIQQGELVAMNKNTFENDYHFQAPGTIITDFVCLPDQQIWTLQNEQGGSRTLHVLDSHLKPTDHFTLPYVIKSLKAGLDGKVWAITPNGLLCLDAQTHAEVTNELTRFCQGKNILFLNTQQKNLLSVGIQNEGIFWYDTQTKKITQADPWQKLNGAKYVSYMDHNGDVWLTGGNGDPECYIYNRLYEHIDFSNLGLTSSYIFTMEADQNGILWMRSANDFIGYDPKAREMVYHQNGHFGLFIIDKKQRIWQISQYSQVHCYEIQGRNLKLLRSYDVEKYVNSICEDPHGKIYLATSDEIAQLEEDGTIRWMSVPEGVQLTSLYEVPPANEIIATTYNKQTYKVEDGKFTIFDQPVKSPSFFYHEKGKGYVIASYNEGVIFYDYTKNTTNRLTIRQNLAENHVKTILRDDQGNWWLGGPNSISRYTRDAQNVSHIHDINYMGRFMYSGSCKAPDGTLYYTGGGGLTVIHPEKYAARKQTMPPLPLYLDLIEAGNELHASNADETLVFGHDENTLTFWFTALQLSLGKHANYAYMLEGRDKGWILAGNNHQATYSKLWAGDYTFKVRVRLENGEWSPEELCQRFTIEAAPWVSWWAKLIYLIILGGAIYAGWRIFLRWKVQKEMLRLAQERIQELVRNTTSTTLPELENAPVEEIQEPILKDSDRQFMEDLYQILDQHLNNNEFSVQQLAAELHQSYSTTYNRIKNLTGETPQHFLTTYRLNRAMELLKSRKYNVSEVSYMVGASSLANFSKAFKKKFGISPSQAANGAKEE